jgi:probable HAF family extracellular repeat protein
MTHCETHPFKEDIVADRYDVTDLGTLPGGNSSQAYGINDLGEVTGSSAAAGGAVFAFLWNSAGAMQSLGALSGNNSGGSGISGNGLVAGQSTWNGSNTHAFLWSASGGMQDLGTLEGDNASAALAVNACGQVAGNSLLTSGGHSHGFVWSRAGGMSSLGVLPGFTDTAVHNINGLGLVVGYCNAVNVANHGFVWSSSSMQKLDTLPGGLSCDAVAINDRGEVAGVGDSGPRTNTHAVLWNQAGAPKDLGVLRGGNTSSALAINILGTVVGNGNCATSDSHAFVWSAKDGMLDLNDLIAPHSGWELVSAAAINAVGQIAGAGSIAGQQRAFLLTPK